MLISGGRAVAACDDGNLRLDEERILSECQELTNTKLQFAAQRVDRWRKRPRNGISAHCASDGNSSAALLLCACERCGEQAGSCWWPLIDESPGWVCEQCHSSLSRGAPWDE